MNGTNSKLIATLLSFVLALSLLSSVALASEDVANQTAPTEEASDVPFSTSEEDEHEKVVISIGLIEVCSEAPLEKTMAELAAEPTVAPDLASSNAGRFVTRLYSLVLDRAPDAAGLRNHVAALNAGVSAADIAWGFFGSAEFSGRRLTNAERIDIAYRTMLDRAPDQSGRANWTGKLDVGMSMRVVISGFAGSPEFRSLCARWSLNPGSLPVMENRDKNYNATAFVQRLYRKVLGRGGDVSGLNAHTGALLAGTSAAETAWGFFSSSEFAGKPLNNGQRVDIAYSTMLDRAPDQSGRANWTGKLDAGMSMRVVISGFAGSPEFRSLCARWSLNPGSLPVMENRDKNYNATAFVQRLYSIVLNRAGDTSGLNAHTGYLHAGGTAAQLAWSFFSSPEFTNRKLSNEQIVEAAYQTMLNRASDAAGKADWVGKMNAGMPLYLLIAGFSGSAEFQKLCRSYGIVPGTLPFDPAELARYESSSGGSSGGDPEPLNVTFQYDSSIKCGEPTTFTFQATGGGGNYRFMPYSLMVKNGNTWEEAINLTYQSYSTRNTFEYEFVMSGDYRLTVAVIDPPDNYRLNRFTTEFTIAAEEGPSYAQRAALAEAKVDEAWEQCQKAGCSTDYEKALWLHDWVIDNCEYDYDLFYCKDIDLFANGMGTCEAYHAAYVKLLAKAGIESGRVYDSGHVWTLVKMDGKWYHVDTTHDDTAGKDWFGLGDDEKYLHFGLNERIISDVLALNGSAIQGQSVQVQSASLDDNYFIKSGRIKNYSDAFTQDIQSHLNNGDDSFELAVPSRLPSAITDLSATSKTILYSLAAYDLGMSTWSANGKNIVLDVSYCAGKFSIKAAYA